MENNEDKEILNKKREEIKQNHKKLLSLLKKVECFLKRGNCYEYFDFDCLDYAQIQISNGGITIGATWSGQEITITGKKVKYNITKSMYRYGNYKTSKIEDLLSNIEEDKDLYCFLSKFQKDFLMELKKITRGEDKKMKEIYLGKEVYLTDTCYEKGTWCQSLLTNVKKGKWLVNYDYDEFNNGKEKQVILSLAHESYGMAIFNDYHDCIKDSGILGVDSGTLGVFDKEYYEKYRYEKGIDEEWYEEYICNNKTERSANITDNKGVWCHTSYGDGEYVAQLYIKDGKIYGIEIIM